MKMAFVKMSVMASETAFTNFIISHRPDFFFCFIMSAFLLLYFKKKNHCFSRATFVSGHMRVVVGLSNLCSCGKAGL